MSSRTCDYVARQSDPESWNGTDSSTFYPNFVSSLGGLELTDWHCPHPPIDQDYSSDDGDDQYCVFHTDPADVPDSVDEREALLNALKDAGNSPHADRPEHRGQFVGATFGAIDLSNETIAATEHHDIRFDHAQFQINDRDLDFGNITFVTKDQNPVSFMGAKFITDGEGDLKFYEATFRTDGEGHVLFSGATFRTNGDGYVLLSRAEFITDGEGDVGFRNAMFRTDGEGDVLFTGATFRTDSDGDVSFREATFRTDSDGDVGFREAVFRTGGEGKVGFPVTTFRTNGEGSLTFRDAILTSVDFRHVEFTETDFSGVDLTGTDLREANLTSISVNGATTCKRLSEGYGDERIIDSPSILVYLKRLYGWSEFDSREWDATARVYHQLKTVFGDHGLVGKARSMHVRERRARSLESRAANGRFDRRYLRSLPSRVFTGYGVQVRNLISWMTVLFFCSTAVYVFAGVEDTLAENISYSVLAFTVAPPGIPLGLGTQLVMMIETFFGTLSIVLLGYILGNRERF